MVKVTSNWISKIKCSKLSYPLRRREVTYYSITIICRMLFIFRLKISLFYKISSFLFFSAYELKSKVDFNSGTKISRLWNSWNWFADGKSLHTRFRRRPLGYGTLSKVFQWLTGMKDNALQHFSSFKSQRVLLLTFGHAYLK